MKKVFIPINTTIPVNKQFPNSQCVWGDFEFIIGKECQEYDYLVVLDDLPRIIRTCCPKENTILFTCEPPSVKKYPKSYTSQFGHAFSCQANLIEQGNANQLMPPLPWMLIYDFFGNSSDKYESFDFFSNTSIDSKCKNNKVCVLTSNKKLTKGHCDRIHFVEILKRRLPDAVDVFGNGYGEMNVKYDVLSKYKYCVVIENCSYYNYWTEKLADAILADCFPIYYGAPNIGDYFLETEVLPIDILDTEVAIEAIKETINQNLYEKRQEQMHISKQKVLYDYNMFSIITRVLSNIKIMNTIKERHIEPIQIPKMRARFKRLETLCFENLPYNLIKYL